MKQAFREFRHTKANKKKLPKLDVVDEIMAWYLKVGMVLTLRGLFYQMVGKGIVVNTPEEYQKLGDLVEEGRMWGLLDWDGLVDNTRKIKLSYSVASVPQALKELAVYYKLNRQEGQSVYLEIWCEKDALASVFEDTAAYYHIPLLVTRGFPSFTAVYDARARFIDQLRLGVKKAVILYVGDYDPSGLAIIEDIRTKLVEFRVAHKVGDAIVGIQVLPIALTMAQVKKAKPALPPSDVKASDSRTKAYVENVGTRYCWEVDALSPRMLQDLVKKHVEGLIDMRLFRQQLAQEEQDKERLRKIADEFDQDQESQDKDQDEV